MTLPFALCPFHLAGLHPGLRPKQERREREVTVVLVTPAPENVLVDEKHRNLFLH